MSPIMQKKVVLLRRPKTLRPKATPHRRSLLLRLLRRRNRNPAKNPVIRKTDHVRALKIFDRLLAAYPDAKCALDFDNPIQLLIATILSAQSTDKTVNTVTPALFRKFRTAEQFANADISELENLVHSTGFFRNKARSIQGACRIIVEDHAGKVPQEMDQLLKLPGVARKTANVVLGVAFGKAEGVVVDTHVQRLSVRLNFTMESRPDKIEEDLMKLFPREKWIHLSHLLIHHGRALCQARRPKCIECPVEDLCKSADKVMA